LTDHGRLSGTVDYTLFVAALMPTDVYPFLVVWGMWEDGEVWFGGGDLLTVIWSWDVFFIATLTIHI